MPIVPTVLVNGAEGIGTGWSTSIPNFNPRDLVGCGAGHVGNAGRTNASGRCTACMQSP